MKTTRTISLLLLFLLAFPMALQAQEKEKRKGEGEEKPGILERIGDEIEKKDEDDEDSHRGVSAFIGAIIDPVDLVNALANMKPGPFPYDGSGSGLNPSEKYPGGVVQLQGTYFQHTTVNGFLWRYNYLYKRFHFTSGLDLLEEDLDDRIDRQSWVTVRFGYDFLALPELLAGGQFGVRTLLDNQATTGPEIGVRLVGLPGQPLVVEGQSTLSLLNGEWLSTHSFSLGVMVWRFEVLFGGYIYRTPDTVLDGWQLGFRAWL